MPLFEGSYLGDDSKIGPGTKLECKVCWYVYDPVNGDPEWQIPPGVPFYDLPEHWACPLCGATKDQFLVLSDET
ncbi:MAG: rubredoxin [Burkholderiales bacterium]|jgi:rubredoxin|nr:rubredoxin [Burkholderiales bacterium]